MLLLTEEKNLFFSDQKRETFIRKKSIKFVEKQKQSRSRLQTDRTQMKKALHSVTSDIA